MFRLKPFVNYYLTHNQKYNKLKLNILNIHIFRLNMTKNFTLQLYQKPQTVFSFTQLQLLFPQESSQSLQNKIHYATKTKKLIHLRRGLYAKPNFKKLEFANKIYTPSYISFETVLAQADIIFQNYQTIFVASYLTRKIKVKNLQISYRKIKNSVLSNPQGLIRKSGLTIANPERAFLDAVYLYKDYHFDNLRPLNWQIINQLSSIYQSKILLSRVKSYYAQHK